MSASAMADARFAALRKQQQQFNAYRAAVAELFGRTNVSDEECRQALDRRERQAEAARAMAEVNRWLAGKHGNRLGRFLGSRPGADPCRIRQLAVSWAKTQGVRL